MSRWSTEDFQGSKTTLYDPIIVDTCHYSFVQTHRVSTMNLGDDGEAVYFMGCNKCPPLVGMLGMGEAVYVRELGGFIGSLCTFCSLLL